MNKNSIDEVKNMTDDFEVYLCLFKILNNDRINSDIFLDNVHFLINKIIVLINNLLN